MPPRLSLSPQHIVELRQLMVQLNNTMFKQRSALVAGHAELYGVSSQTVYRWLQQVGWSSGRKRRSDTGSTSLSDAAIKAGAALQRTATRKNGKIVMPATVGYSILHNNGENMSVGVAQFRRLIRQRQMDARTQARDNPHTHTRSDHPNHVHQLDPSLCVLYYMRGRQYMMEADRFYKNKLDNYAKVKAKVWRYVLVDHTSSYIVPWYVEAAGENTKSLFEFLLFAWGKQGDRPFHGVPKILLWDKGSANTSGAICSLLDALEVKYLTHAPGNARAKGSVEGGNNIVETQFESRLKAQPVESVEELNDAANRWANAYNANLIPAQDTRLRRSNRVIGPRTDLWLTITEQQLRVLPSPDECRALMVGKPVERLVQGDLTISYRHPQATASASYDLTDFRVVSVGDKVNVAPLVYGECAVLVTLELHNGETMEYRAEPVTDFTRYGFRTDAPVLGEEYKAKPVTPVERQGQSLDKLAYGDLSPEDMKKAKAKGATPFAGEIDTHGHLTDIELPQYMPRRGTAIETGRRFEETRLSHIAAAKELRRILPDYQPFHLQHLKNQYPDGITELELQSLIRRFQTPGFSEQDSHSHQQEVR